MWDVGCKDSNETQSSIMPRFLATAVFKISVEPSGGARGVLVLYSQKK
jgi:hypothetical protein